MELSARVCLLTVTIGSIATAIAQESFVQQVYKQPDTIATAARGVEAISKRTINARHFKNPDGTWTAISGSGLNYDDGTGKLAPVLPELWQGNKGGWELRAGALTVTIPKTNTGHDLQHTYTAKDGKRHTFTLSFPNLTWRQKAAFTFSLDGLTWNLIVDNGRTDFTTVVASRKGAHTYSFDYDVKGLSLSINGPGSVVGDDGASLSRAAMLRADGQAVQCSPWTADNKTLSFSCDDSGFPASAFPYTIDPTLQAPRTGAAYCAGSVYGGYSRPTQQSTHSCSSGDSGIQDWDSYDPIYGVASWYDTEQDYAFDTTSIPSNATVSAASLIFTVTNANFFQPAGTACYLNTFATDSIPVWLAGNGVPFNTYRVDNVWTAGNQEVSIPPSAIVKGGSSVYINNLRCTLTYDNYSGAQVSLGGSTLSVTYTVPQTYTLTTSINPSGAGSVALNPPGGSYSSNQVVTLTASAADGYVFSNWSGPVANTAANPTTVTMTGPVSVTANYLPKFSIGGYQLVSSTRVTVTQYDFNYRATLTNNGPPIIGASATVTSTDPYVLVRQGTLHFDAAGTGASVLSTDTFTIRMDRTRTLDFNVLVWSVQPIIPPALSVAKSHSGNFTQGQTGAGYTVTVSNSASAGPTSGMVTVTETIPTGLTLVSMTGTGWACASTSCTRSDVLGAGASYPPITVTVNVALTAPATLTNQVGVSGGGSASNSINDSTIINPAPAVLSITKSHSGSFTQGQQNAVYTLTVSNSSIAGPASGTVTVSESAPFGLTVTSMSGAGWNCSVASCSRNDVLAAGASYPSITVSVVVSSQAPPSLVNQASVSGGGSATASASDSTVIQPGVTLTTVATPSGFGSIGLDPPGGTYPSGQIVRLTASPTSGHRFKSWTGNVPDPNSATNNVTISVAETVTATFEAVYTLTTSVSPSFDAGTVTPSGGTYASDTVVQLTAQPSTGYRFVNWTGNVASPNSAITTIAMTASQVVTANFTSSLTAGYAPTKTEINLFTVNFDTYNQQYGDVYAGCEVKLQKYNYTPRECLTYLASALVDQGVSGIRFFVQLNLPGKSSPFVTTGTKSDLTFGSDGNPVLNSAWMANFGQFMTDMKAAGIQRVNIALCLDGCSAERERVWGPADGVTPTETNCPPPDPTWTLKFSRTLPFGLYYNSSNFPVDIICAFTEHGYQLASKNPIFWGWDALMYLFENMLDKISAAQLDIGHFELQQEVNLIAHTVYGRLIYDNKGYGSVPPFGGRDVLGADPYDENPSVRTFRKIMRQKGFNPYRVGVSVQHQRPSSVAFTCPSWWGDTAQILNLTALLGAYGGPYGRFGTPAFGSITQNSLFCFVPGAEGKDEDDRLNTASMDFLPLFYDYPAVLDLHAYPCVRDPLDEATCQAGDVTTTAQTLYNQLQKTINDRGLALKEMLFGETFSAGQGCPDDTRAHQSVDGYRGNDIAASSDLYLQHSALTTFSMWYVPFYFSCKNPPDFIPTVNPPYNSKNR